MPKGDFSGIAAKPKAKKTKIEDPDSFINSAAVDGDAAITGNPRQLLRARLKTRDPHARRGKTAKVGGKTVKLGGNELNILLNSYESELLQAIRDIS